jgi:nicotinate-nucleotide pyrophosphorylase (carboxylating)
VHESLLPLVKFALSEDVGTGDVTSLNCVPPNTAARATLIARAPGVVSGLDIARMTFHEVDASLRFEPLVRDGQQVAGDTVLATITGSAASLMTAERTALNFMMRLCGVATLTRRYVDAIAGTGAAILDTRKTTPGLRILEKYAVLCGGGQNHRLALWDMYLVKDNHIRAAGGVTRAIDLIQRTRRDLLLEVEVETEAQLREALRPEVDRILFDNRTPETVREWVAIVDEWSTAHPADHGRVRKGARRWPEIEVSGGITLDTVRAYAETGVDYLSVGALTHSAVALDLSLEIEEVG